MSGEGEEAMAGCEKHTGGDSTLELRKQQLNQGNLPHQEPVSRTSVGELTRTLSVTGGIIISLT